MARTRKTKRDIIALIDQYRDVFQYYNLKKIVIPKPRLTPTLSESLLAYLLEDNRVTLGKYTVTDVAFSKSGGDLVVTETGGKTVRVEVKSTAECAFQYFGQKDCDADYLVWLHFGTALQTSVSNNIEIIVIAGADLRAKKHQLPKSMKVTLARIKEVFPKAPMHQIAITEI